MQNDDLIKQIRQVVREEVKAETEPIKEQLGEQGGKLDTLLGEAEHTRTALEALEGKIDETKTEVDEIKQRQRPRHAD